MTTTTKPPSPLKPMLILMGSGIVLGVGGCALFLGAMDKRDAPMIGGGLFVVGVLLTLAGIVYGLVLAVRRFLGR